MALTLRWWWRALSALSTGALLALVAASRVAAQEGDAPSTPTTGEGIPGFGGWDWVDLALRLGLVLFAIWAVVMAMRWYLRRTGSIGGGRGKQHLRILESRSLGPNRSLQLVRLGGRAVLLGVTQERVNSLLEIDDPEEVERLSAPAVEEAATPGTLASLVSGFQTALSAPSRLRARRTVASSAAAASLVDQHRAHRGLRVSEAQEALGGSARPPEGFDFERPNSLDGLEGWGGR